ncbi:AAA family ATPase [Citreicella sp. C3M06]|uniref:ATP-dependent nuclease n=1 Tax=Citreicella sp. C3M06 TaxID=2841564 RepID=UPI001C0925D0|nr:AAA family ATPase [Citreicella sp. C3M06]MBU2960268.1 AAA family ATPase [Citreicella sp. C3M06]
MYIKELRLKNFRCFGDHEEIISLGPEMTAFIGDNGSGKTTVIRALQRLFGGTASERSLRRDDVHFGAGEVPGPVAQSADSQDIPAVSSREIYIEAILDFPELTDATEGGSGTGLDVSVETFHAMSCAGPGAPLQARIRLEANWEFGIDEDDIDQRVYWVTTTEEVPFGDDDIAKIPMSTAQRRRIQLKYLPATRNNSAVVKSAMKELLVWLERFGDLSSGKQQLEMQRADLQKVFDELPAVNGVVSELTKNWGKLFKGELYSEAKLSILAQEIHKALRDLTLKLSPTESGTEYAIEDLSEGQASLLYISIIASIIQLNERHIGRSVDGYRDVPELKPWLTIIALEEPENHLSPFYLSRMIALMSSMCAGDGAMGILTTHSSGAIGRVEPENIRHMRHDEKSRISYSNIIGLPATIEEKYKYIYEAVRSNPELYFARLVVLGEGRSEEIVLPRLARAFHPDLDLDPAFVAFVPLGGRHVNHFWKLLNDLNIPHVTLLDYDLGRYNAGRLRLKYASDQLSSFGVNPPYEKPKDANAWRALGEADLRKWYAWVRANGVHFSLPLDLDMMMLKAFPEQYRSISGVKDASELNASDFVESVFGKAGNGLADYPKSKPTAAELAIYDDLFKKGSKPIAHIEALASLTDAELKAKCPMPLQKLFKDCAARLGIELNPVASK